MLFRSIPDRFIEHGTVAQLQHIAGIDVEAIKARIKNFEFVYWGLNSKLHLATNLSS